MYVNDMLGKMGGDSEGIPICASLYVNTLLYVDDITILTYTVRSLQNILKMLGHYCADNHISLNIANTQYLLVSIHIRGIPMYLNDTSEGEGGIIAGNIRKRYTNIIMITILGGGPYMFGANTLFTILYNANTCTEHTARKGGVVITLEGQ